MQIKGKTVIVTGSGKGIGRALAIAFAGVGANVVLCGRNEQDLQESALEVNRCGVKSLCVKADVAVPADVQTVVSRALEKFGGVHVLFNNAGSMTKAGATWETDIDEWWNVFAVNLRGTMLCSHAALPHMIKNKEGLVINMSGGGALSPLLGASAYGSSKAAILRFTDTIAQELSLIGSPVITFAMDPGFNRTQMTEGLAATKDIEMWMPHVRKMIDAGEGNKPEDCGQTALELIAAAAPWMSGRLFFAGENTAQLVAQKQRIADEDLRTMRFRNL